MSANGVIEKRETTFIAIEFSRQYLYLLDFAIRLQETANETHYIYFSKPFSFLTQAKEKNIFESSDIGLAAILNLR